MSEQIIHFNGIDGATGKYLLALPLSDLAKLVRGDKPKGAHLRDLQRRQRIVQRRQDPRGRALGVAEGIDDKDLSQAGWGVIFPAELPPKDLGALKDALKPLLEHRQKLAGNNYMEFSGTNGFRPDDTKESFLVRQGADAANAADPRNGVPYYLLLVGDPEQIPYSFQYELDVIYAVGRLHFETYEEYNNYARTVQAAETGQIILQPRTTFWGVMNSGDVATGLSAEQLVKPLAVDLKQIKFETDWQYQTYLATDATKKCLAGIINGPEAPALLFTASHGMGFPVGDPLQVRHQGALLCQDWPGPQSHRGPIPSSYYFSADDVADNANFAGMIAFHFACFGGGTPRLDDFAKNDFAKPKPIAERAFVARLPQRLLGHPRGGALAVIAHVERAWGYSFLNSASKNQLGSFDSTLKRLLKGQPVGVAFEYFNDRYAAWATALTTYLQRVDANLLPDSEDAEFRLAELWTAQNDSRGYAILGDPAARLSVGDQPTAIRRPVSWELTPAPLETKYSIESSVQALPFGLLDPLKELGEKTQRRVTELIAQLDHLLTRTMDDAAHLEISTYDGSDISKVTPGAESLAAAQLRALTRISPTGDVRLFVPANESDLPEHVWRAHTAAVAQAQANRLETLKALSEILATLGKLIKPI